MYAETHSIEVSHSDAAGLIYFGRIYELGQIVVENYLNKIGYGIGQMLTEKNYITPVVHSEADYLSPMRVRDEVTIEIGIENVGHSSFTSYCLFFSIDRRLLARSKTVSVSIDKKTGQKITLPEDLRAVLMDNWEKSKASHSSMHK